MLIIIKGKSGTQRPPNDNSYLRAKDESFMRDNSHRKAAFNILCERIKIFEKQGKNAGEFLDHCRKRGYMKTQDDLEIVSKVMEKSKLIKGEAKTKKENKFMKQMREEGRKLKREKFEGKELQF